MPRLARRLPSPTLTLLPLVLALSLALLAVHAASPAPARAQDKPACRVCVYRYADYKGQYQCLAPERADTYVLPHFSGKSVKVHWDDSCPDQEAIVYETASDADPSRPRKRSGKSAVLTRSVADITERPIAMDSIEALQVFPRGRAEADRRDTGGCGICLYSLPGQTGHRTCLKESSASLDRLVDDTATSLVLVKDACLDLEAVLYKKAGFDGFNREAENSEHQLGRRLDDSISSVHLFPQGRTAWAREQTAGCGVCLFANRELTGRTRCLTASAELSGADNDMAASAILVKDACPDLSAALYAETARRGKSLALEEETTVLEGPLFRQVSSVAVYPEGMPQAVLYTQEQPEPTQVIFYQQPQTKPQLVIFQTPQQPKEQQFLIFDLSEKDFENPTIKGAAIDWCYRFGDKCGSAAADRFCQSKGFDEAVQWNVKNTDRTWVMGAKRYCTGVCGGYTHILCGTEPEGDGYKRFAKPKLNGARLDWCHQWGENCGNKAATAFCQSKGYGAAIQWSKEKANRTYVMGAKKFCTANCGAYYDILCGPAPESE